MEIKLLDRGEFIITLNDSRNLKGKFGMWSLQRFSEKTGIENVIQILLDFGRGLTVKQYCQFILSALEYTYRKNPAGFTDTEEDVLEWIDDMGGLSDDKFLTLIRHGIGRHVRIKDKDVEEDEQKKSQQDILDGGNSNETAAGQE